ncbi:MAG: glycyl-radical enzyme activating protein [Mogibacterium sp.]|nr:glycyl-radical enzyme activating protein [Mogibacterium sp.]
MSVKGYVMQIQPFSVNDGEGIRTNIFMAGCPLRCRWCSNPEGFEQKELIGWYKRRCIGCGACAAVCPQGIGIGMEDRSRCIACGACVKACPGEARARMVTLMDADDVIREVMKHRLFYSYSGGGVTFSGGEATSQPEFLDYVSRELYDSGISIDLESCGYFDFDLVRQSLERMDLIFMDLKHMDPEEHRKYTGVGNERILENIARLGSLREKPEIVIRIPVIGGANNSEENIAASAAYVHDVLPEAKMELLSYHSLGKIKYEATGIPFDQDGFYTPDKEEMKKLRGIAAAHGPKIADYR